VAPPRASQHGEGDTFRPQPDVVSRRLDDQTVLVNLRTNRIFELNRTGARLWDLLGEGSSESQIVERLLAEFDVPQEQLEREVRELIDSLLDEGLIGSDNQGT
jgi:Coenzyme PQQ synthesis protein D (PqqD)